MGYTEVGTVGNHVNKTGTEKITVPFPYLNNIYNQAKDLSERIFPELCSVVLHNAVPYLQKVPLKS